MTKGVNNLRHTGVVVSNLKKSLHFYRDLLGLVIVKQSDEKGVFLDKILNLENVQVTTTKMRVGVDGLVELLYFKSHPRGVISKEACSIGPTHIAFTVHNLEQEYRRLKKAGVVFNAPPQVSSDGYAKVTFCSDPDGTLIELVEVL